MVGDADREVIPVRALTPAPAGNTMSQRWMAMVEEKWGIFLPSKYAFRARFSHFSLSLTSPSGRKYITHVVKQEDSSVGAGIRGVTEKGNSYL
jgi:hypothetical protein